MLSNELVEKQPIQTYSEIPKECIFIGTKIKNLYDEKRLCIQENYAPGRYRLNNIDLNLFGIVKEITDTFGDLVRKIRHQKQFDLIGYNLLLNENNLTCNNCYYNLNPPIYPIDNHHIKKIIPEFDYENFICFNPEIPKFQAFTSLNLFLIVQD